MATGLKGPFDMVLLLLLAGCVSVCLLRVNNSSTSPQTSKTGLLAPSKLAKFCASDVPQKQRTRERRPERLTRARDE